MNHATVISLEQAKRDREWEEPRTLSEDDLAATQGTIDFKDCHVALCDVAYVVKAKKIRFTLLSSMSIGIPKGRKIALMGHKGSGKSLFLELLAGKAPPTRGHVVRNSRISWPVTQTPFFDQKLTIRDNLIFVARTLLQCPPRYVIERAVIFCELETKQLESPLSELNPAFRRRLGYLLALMAQFDLHLFDGKPSGFGFGFQGDAARRFEEFALNRDYFLAAAQPGAVPANADLAYILYDGRLYMFDDVSVAKQTFSALPPPLMPDLSKDRGGDGGDAFGLDGF